MRHNLSLEFRSEEGVALPVALFALVVVGALVSGMFFTARNEVRSGENTMGEARAMEAAQAGLQMGWPHAVSAAGALGDGQTVALPKTQLGTTGSFYQDSVTRLNRHLYLVRSYGTYEVGGKVNSARVMATLVKRFAPELMLNSPVIVRGLVTVTGSVYLDGTDRAPPGWSDCPPATRMEPGLRSNGVAVVTGGAQVVPIRATQMDTTVNSLARVLDTTFFQLASQADKTLSATTTINLGATPATGSGPCVTTTLTNWGDPARSSPANACERYFPVVYLNNGNPSTTYTIHGDGQGVLLVNGNLKFNGDSHFAGLMLVRGSFVGGNGNFTIDGAGLALGINATPSTLSGNLRINFSTCAVDDALSHLSQTLPVSQRGVMQF